MPGLTGDRCFLQIFPRNTPLLSHSALKAAFSYSAYGKLRGDTEYHFADGSVITYENAEGADFKAVMFSLSYVYDF